ncbi:hypothetical protein NQ315_017543 [Exocentrus adspersus]|uniref:Uncharacterized protein n=1 Tax=Exocentrus adspersus TaxID=1586481 RepID=A0AAV8VJB4_9CUCU|nr:hypothetical protein NQ315_017543 [Exocentrus adspersus]
MIDFVQFPHSFNGHYGQSVLTGIQIDNVLREIILIGLKINFEESPTMIRKKSLSLQKKRKLMF